MKRLALRSLSKFLFLGLFLSGTVAEVHASGYYGPESYLEQGGARVAGMPEFYWEREIRRLAQDFHPGEKRLPARMQDGSSGLPAFDAATEDADTADFEAALASGEIKPFLAGRARSQHRAARQFLSQAEVAKGGPLPKEFSSEFSDYHRGAWAYRQGKWDQAKDAWQALLKRPATERHFRTVWAVYMLGRTAINQQYPAAANWFRETRARAAQGFADSLGMAAESYGWEAKSELDQGRPDRAAPLYLTQLALGDRSALVSLKALVPDRAPIEYYLNFGPGPNDPESRDTAEKLKKAASDPLLRRIVTIHILATESYVANQPVIDPADRSVSTTRCRNWLGALKAVGAKRVADAEYIGWIAYNNGDYAGAAEWLKDAAPRSSVANWLRAKLERRRGDLTAAAKSMTMAEEGIPKEEASASFGDRWSIEGYGAGFTFDARAAGDLGAMQLEQNRFIEALSTFLKGNLGSSAGFVADRILTADELKREVDKGGEASRLRPLLGRRLAREGRYKEASLYLPEPYDRMILDYAEGLSVGQDTTKSKTVRARALFEAAWLCRRSGMELLGSEGYPDDFQSSGASPGSDLAEEWRHGAYDETHFDHDQIKTVPRPLVLKPTQEELRRLKQSQISPEIRYHYRLIAAAHAIHAARLMPDETEELADVLNQAGRWIKNSDEKLGDRYYNMIEARCNRTSLGRQVLAQHWFVDEDGPWSREVKESVKSRYPL